MESWCQGLKPGEAAGPEYRIVLQWSIVKQKLISAPLGQICGNALLISEVQLHYPAVVAPPVVGYWDSCANTDASAKACI